MIETLRTLLKEPSLELVLSEAYSSTHESGRADLRRRVLREFVSTGVAPTSQDIKTILDLTVPLLKVGPKFLSISHCGSFGGFLLSDRPVGFDAEEVLRVTDRAVKRVSTLAESLLAPAPAWLWSAKEASFKALQHLEKRPEVVSQIEIGDWKPVGTDSRIGTFRVKNLSDFSSRAALGCVIREKDHVLAAFSLQT